MLVVGGAPNGWAPKGSSKRPWAGAIAGAGARAETGASAGVGASAGAGAAVVGGDCRGAGLGGSLPDI